MKSLGIKYELELLARGTRAIAGVDEAGRGPWAGPVVAACLLFDEGAARRRRGLIIHDCKKLDAVRREASFIWLTKNFRYGIGVISHEVIDKIGIAVAAKLAMREAVLKLAPTAEYLLIDAFRLKELTVPQENIIKGDQKIWSIAAASIIAKVTRDRLMMECHELYPQYGFDRHKGYGTKLHQVMLQKYGPCPIHRRSYEPIKQLVTRNQ